MKTYDYVIVGGGTSGVVLATRLAERVDATVALIEAGPTDADRPEVLEVRDWMDLLGGELDYDYAIEEQPRGNSLVRHSRARVLGGCSSHNSCIAFQPPDSDLNAWAAAGATGWGPQDCAPYFRRVWDTVEVSEPGGRNPLNRAILAAAHEAGLPEIKFNQEPLRRGAAPFQLNVADGRRQSSSVAYLHRREQPPDLDILTETSVNELRFDGDRKVTGVETSAGPITARREVVVCAGAFDTPTLLMRSGIGPAKHLEDLGIRVRAAREGVGGHLLDHPEGVVVWETRVPPPEPITQYWELGFFDQVDDDAPAPDLMLHGGLMPFTMNTEPAGYPAAEHGFSLTPNVPRARSEGTVRLASPDPSDPPKIDFRYFTDSGGYDERIMVAGVRLARRIAAGDSLAEWIEREIAPGPNVTSDTDISEYVRSTANTVYHPAGTCRMGDRSDPTAVVDPQLRVIDVENLRICDASVFPALPSVNPAITCMMLGERAADLVGEA